MTDFITPLSATPANRGRPGIARATVLLVESDRTVAQLVRSYLDGEGYRIAEVDAVGAMRDALEHGEFDLVLLGAVPADADGCDAQHWLRARPALPVMMLTDPDGAVTPIVDPARDGAGAKPVDLSMFLTRLRMLVRCLEPSPAAPADGTVLRSGG